MHGEGGGGAAVGGQHFGGECFEEVGEREAVQAGGGDAFAVAFGGGAAGGGEGFEVGPQSGGGGIGDPAADAGGAVAEGCQGESGAFGGELFLAFEGLAFGFFADLGGDDLEHLPGEASQWGGGEVVGEGDQVQLGAFADLGGDGGVVGGELVEGVRDHHRLVEVDPPVQDRCLEVYVGLVEGAGEPVQADAGSVVVAGGGGVPVAGRPGGALLGDVTGGGHHGEQQPLGAG